MGNFSGKNILPVPIVSEEHNIKGMILNLNSGLSDRGIKIVEVLGEYIASSSSGKYKKVINFNELDEKERGDFLNTKIYGFCINNILFSTVFFNRKEKTIAFH